MISELIEIARLNNLSGWESTRQRKIHWFIELDEQGKVVGFSPTTRTTMSKRGETKTQRGKLFKVPANYHMQWKNNKVQSVCTNDSNWLPDFLSGPANEIFPAGVYEDKIYRLREVITAIRNKGTKHPDRNRLVKLNLWRRQIFRAEADNPSNRIIRAIATYIRSLHCLRFSELPISEIGEQRDRMLRDFDDGKENISFRVSGKIALSDTDLRNWWKQQVGLQRDNVIANLSRGTDAYDSKEGPITDYFPTVFSSIPFASFNFAPFTSYGLGSQTTTFRLETAEKVAAGLRWLLKDSTTSLKLDEEVAVFWAVRTSEHKPETVSFLQLLEHPDPLTVKDYLCAIWGSHRKEIEVARFKAATMLPSQGRFSVRSWHTDTLENADKNVRNYFASVSLGDGEGETPSISQLAWATISKAKNQKTAPPPTTFSALFQTALFGEQLPHKIFASAIIRQKSELAGKSKDTDQFDERIISRTALIKLYFAVNRNIIMNETTISNDDHPAVLCGRLLAILDKIHKEAHGNKSASSPANRLYGAASATPALIFPQLQKLARHHLNKIGGGWKYRLEFGYEAAENDKLVKPLEKDFEALAQITARLKDVADNNYPRILSLEDQGRFSIGFYYERCRKWPKTKDGTETNKP